MTAQGTARRGWRYRTNVASRAAGAVLGGYGISSCFAMTVARLPVGARIDAVIAGTMAAYLVIPIVAVCVFLARGPWRAWGGILAAIALMSGLMWMMGAPAR